MGIDGPVSKIPQASDIKLEPEDDKVLEKHALGWKIGNIFYMIKESILGVFGASDWDALKLKVSLDLKKPDQELFAKKTVKAAEGILFAKVLSYKAPKPTASKSETLSSELGVKPQKFSSEQHAKIQQLILLIEGDLKREPLEGIYRLSADADDLSSAKKQFATDGSVSDDVKGHTLTGLFKSYIRELNTKQKLVLLPLENLKELSEGSDTDISEKMQQIPDENRAVLKDILQHLNNVAKYETTQMTAENLAVVFAPNLFNLTTQEQAPLAVEILKRLIENPELVPS